VVVGGVGEWGGWVGGVARRCCVSLCVGVGVRVPWPSVFWRFVLESFCGCFCVEGGGAGREGLDGVRSSAVLRWLCKGVVE